jgi:U6 snRNA-associated Sm-like protein LSm1
MGGAMPMTQGAPMPMPMMAGAPSLGQAAVPGQQPSQGQVFEFLPGVASLVEDLDQRVLVTLRDGRHFVGIMRSFDQYGNVMLEDTFERHVVGSVYADERVGLYVIRGENLVLLGELDMEKEAQGTAMREVPLEQIMAQKAALKQEKADDDLLRKKLSQQALGLGFEDCL